MPDIFYNFIDFWSTPTGAKTIIYVKFFLIFLSFFFAFWIVFFLRKSAYLWNMELYKETITKGSLPKGKIPKKWQEILSKIETPEEANHKLAIIEADALLDDTLKKLGFSGETMTEKIEKITAVQLKSVSDLREAHKTRNHILHDPDFRLAPQGGKDVIGLYENVLKELEVL